MLSYAKVGRIWIPEGMKVRNWIVTGTPGSGKTFLIGQVGAIPGEICIDISMAKWWKVPPLAQRPREVHFSLPFVGHQHSHPVYDEIWTRAEELPRVDLDRIRIPTAKKFILAPDWRARFVFDFIIPPPKWIYETRRRRFAAGDTKLEDIGITMKLVKWQARTLSRVGAHFDACGLHVLVRPFNLAYPYRFAELREAAVKKSESGDRSVFPEGSEMGEEITLRRWIRKTAPKDWRKSVKKGMTGT